MPKTYLLIILFSLFLIDKMQAQQKEQSSKLGIKYLEYFPEIIEGKDKLPLLIFLHGMGERGNDLNKLKVHGPPSFLDNKKDFPFITISPQCPDTVYWNEEILLPFYEEIINKYPIDKDRIYITGLSMGGFGTWGSIVAKPNLFAAAAPICGGGNPNKLEAVKSMPIWVFHGAKDNVVPIIRSQEMVDRLKKLGSKVKFTIYPKADHNSWTITYANPELYKWFLSHKKK
ncbi:prolyl oligopeptidase family serine peptidase [Marinifilum sp. RC60d5]|uniref:prolyl oligopeptidase family serine peptidase n=1 Tax=Marinifilum sp. RC60d5 TaxID=3458414 RepID=UPI004035DFF8